VQITAHEILHSYITYYYSIQWKIHNIVLFRIFAIPACYYLGWWCLSNEFEWKWLTTVAKWHLHWGALERSGYWLPV